MCKVPYLEAIGSLNYLAVATQPNISFSVLLLVQFMGEFTGRLLNMLMSLISWYKDVSRG